MKVVSVWNPKGGQGKSLICINVAAAAYELGLKPLVICQDPQGTATLFATEGHLPFKVLPEIPDKQPDADLVIIDHVAADWSDPIASIVVMPTKPVRTDYATFADAYTQVKESGKRVIKVVTDGSMSRKSEKETTLFLKQSGAFEIRSSVAFSNAADEYRTIFDPELNKSHNVKERRLEVEAILAAVLNEGD